MTVLDGINLGDTPSDADNLYSRALAALPFAPLEQQEDVLRGMADFAAAGGDRDVFVLNGYAGTGKTSLVGALIKAMDRLKRPVVVLAPTGRGAKVASHMSSHPASTIHRRLFRPDIADPTGRRYVLARNETRNTLFIVDEASLISDSGRGRDGSLLQLLVQYVYSAPGCRMLLMGDEAQLPPVGQTEANSMKEHRLRELGLNPLMHVLDIPMRQGDQRGIIHNATLMRLQLMMPDSRMPVHLEAGGFPDVRVISGRELPDELADSYAQVGQDETLIITRSNWRANDFNKAIRAQVMDFEEPVVRGDRLVITKNDYYWSKINKAGTLIANGDMAEVTWTGHTEKMYGRYFTEVELQMSDGRIITAQLMLRSLMAEGAGIPRDEMEAFYNRIAAGAEGELSEKIAAALNDPYYNALQAKYAYCVTCHKAQGGEWKHVYIDMGGIDPEALGPEFFRWIYTAITRATERVYFINPTIPVE